LPFHRAYRAQCSSSLLGSDTTDSLFLLVLVSDAEKVVLVSDVVQVRCDLPEHFRLRLSADTGVMGGEPAGVLLLGVRPRRPVMHPLYDVLPAHVSVIRRVLSHAWSPVS